MGISLMRPTLTPEKERPKAYGFGMTLKLLFNKNKIGGNLGACCSLWVAMGVARPVAINLNNKEL